MQISNFRLGIGVPLSFHMVESEFFETFIMVEKPDYIYIRPRNIDVSDPRQQRIDAMRNNIVEQALASSCSHLWMIDTDQSYPANILLKLLSHKKQVVGARIRRRYPPFDNILFRGDIGSYNRIPREEALSGKLVEVDATGTGCILFDMEIFRKLDGPWFLTGSKDGALVGEDFKFCSRLRKNNIPIYVDTSAYVHHLSQFGITDGFADVFEKINRAIREKEEKENGL